MKEHIKITKSKGYKNKLIAQEVGIAVAKNTFKDMLNVDFQGFMFSWDSYTLLDLSKTQLFLYFKSEPKNLDELKVIAFDSALIEFSNLKESYGAALPVRIFDDEELLHNLKKMTTRDFLMGREIDFYHREEHKKIKNFDSIWKDKFIEEHSVEDLKKLAVKRLEEIADIKKINANVKSAAMKEIENYWSGITNLKDALYSSL